jgi:hypothetical protein
VDSFPLLLERSILCKARVNDSKVEPCFASFAGLHLEMFHAVKLALFCQNIHPFGQGFEAQLDDFDWNTAGCPREESFGGSFHVIDFPHNTPVWHFAKTKQYAFDGFERV